MAGQGSMANQGSMADQVLRLFPASMAVQVPRLFPASTDRGRRTCSRAPTPARSAGSIMEAWRGAFRPAGSRASEADSTEVDSTAAGFMAGGEFTAGGGADGFKTEAASPPWS